MVTFIFTIYLPTFLEESLINSIQYSVFSVWYSVFGNGKGTTNER